MGKTWALIFNKSGFKSQSAAHQLCDSVGLVTPSPFASVSLLSPEDFGGPVQRQFCHYAGKAEASWFLGCTGSF